MAQPGTVKRRRVGVIVAVAVGVAAAAGVALRSPGEEARWTPYTSMEGDFAVELPGPPLLGDIDDGAGEVLSAEKGEFLMTVVRLSVEPGSLSDTVYQGLEHRLAQPGSVLLLRSVVTWLGMPCHRTVWESSGGRQFELRLVVREGLLYGVAARLDGDHAASARRVFDSFRLTGQ